MESLVLMEYSWSLQMVILFRACSCSGLTSVAGGSPPTFVNPPRGSRCCHILVVQENNSDRRTLLTVSATDPDGDVLTYDVHSIKPPTPGLVFEGRKLIYVPGGLDAETATSHKITFKVSDGTNTVYSNKVDIVVGDHSEFEPQFLPGQEHLELARPVLKDQLLTTLNAEDGDASAKILYKLTGAVGCQTKWFTLMRKNGKLFYVSDRRFPSGCVLHVKAADGTYADHLNLTIVVQQMTHAPNASIQTTPTSEARPTTSVTSDPPTSPSVYCNNTGSSSPSPSTWQTSNTPTTVDTTANSVSPTSATPPPIGPKELTTLRTRKTTQPRRPTAHDSTRELSGKEGLMCTLSAVLPGIITLMRII